MAGINDIKPLGPVWPTPATKPVSVLKEQKKSPDQQQQPGQQQDENDKDDDGANHIDEYA